MSALGEFNKLDPMSLLDSMEQAMGVGFTGLVTPLPSYINRVYEVEDETGRKLVAKFYRPGRWTVSAIEEEHQFLEDCALDEIPVILPVQLTNGSTIAYIGDIPFSVFPKKGGRLFELNTDMDYVRVGSLIGRIHLAGKKRKAENRVVLHPQYALKKDIDYLAESGAIPDSKKMQFMDICRKIKERITPLFENVFLQRIHGDCHRGNILDRGGDEGLNIIDFDDMAIGPKIHDLWMLLPSRLSESKPELSLMLEGYNNFSKLDPGTIRLVEPLRAMRIIYFLAWSARQRGDHSFKEHHPNWGTEQFWEQEIHDLKLQYSEIEDSLDMDINMIL